MISVNGVVIPCLVMTGRATVQNPVTKNIHAFFYSLKRRYVCAPIVIVGGIGRV